MELKKLANLLFFIILVTSCQHEKQQKIFVIQGEAQGSTYAIKYISNEEVVQKASIDSLLLAFDMSLSTYRPDSKISKIRKNKSSGSKRIWT